MIQLVSCKCPECKAEIEIKSDKEYAFCPYCGTKLLIHNDNVTTHYEYKYQYNYDEAKRIKVEADERIKNRKLDIAEKTEKRKITGIVLYIVFCAIMCAASLLFYFFAKSFVGAIVQTATIFCILLPIVLHITGSILKHDKPTVTTSTDTFLYGLIESSYQSAHSPIKTVLLIWLLFFFLILISFAFLAYPFYKDSVGIFSFFEESNTIGYSFAFYEDKERDTTINANEIEQKYSFMQSSQDLYIATILSENTVKIQNYQLVASDGPSAYEYDYDVCVIRVSSDNQAFSWVDAEHTSFLVTMRDEKNYYLHKNHRVCFSVVNEDSDEWKNCYSSTGKKFYYQNDSQNLYRAIILSEEAIKIEKWKKDSDAAPLFFHESDFCVIKTIDERCDFYWVDDKHEAFTITLRDKNNWYWKNEKIVCFQSEDNG